MKDDGGSAFPTDFSYECELCHTQVMATTPHVGMSLRDYFAAAALSGYRSASLNWCMQTGGKFHDPKQMATWAYADADAMLAERAKEQS